MRKELKRIPRRVTAIPDSPDTKRLLDSLPRIYAVGCWARYGVREYYYSGRSTKDGIPLVWDLGATEITHSNYYHVVNRSRTEQSV